MTGPLPSSPSIGMGDTVVVNHINSMRVSSLQEQTAEREKMTDFCCLLNSTRSRFIAFTLPSNSHSTPLQLSRAQVSRLRSFKVEIFAFYCLVNVDNDVNDDDDDE